MVLVYALVAFFAGLLITMQPGMNSKLQEHLGHPTGASALSFAAGTVICLTVAVFTGAFSPSKTSLGEAPWWAWMGGVLGAVFVTATLIVAPKLGASLLVACVLAGQIVGGSALDHFGLVGFQKKPINWKLMVGVVLILSGLVFVAIAKRQASETGGGVQQAEVGAGGGAGAGAGGGRRL